MKKQKNKGKKIDELTVVLDGKKEVPWATRDGMYYFVTRDVTLHGLYLGEYVSLICDRQYTITVHSSVILRPMASIYGVPVRVIVWA